VDCRVGVPQPIRSGQQEGRDTTGPGLRSAPAADGHTRRTGGLSSRSPTPAARARPCRDAPIAEWVVPGSGDLLAGPGSNTSDRPRSWACVFAQRKSGLGGRRSADRRRQAESRSVDQHVEITDAAAAPAFTRAENVLQVFDGDRPIVGRRPGMWRRQRRCTQMARLL